MSRVLPRRSEPGPAIHASVALHALALPGLALAPQQWSWVLGGMAANHAALAVLGMMPRSQALGPNLVRLPQPDRPGGQVALTFDDGPDPDVTPRVLDLLDREGARTSFFCIGRRVAAYPALTREIAARGHSVENHTDRHPAAFACYTPAALAREIGAAQARIADATGRAPRFFRAPMGLRSPLLEPALARAGLTLVSWTRRGRDGLGGDPRRVLHRLTHRLAPGDVLVLHDRLWRGTAPVLAVLPALLRDIAARGLVPVSLADALAPVASVSPACVLAEAGAASAP